MISLRRFAPVSLLAAAVVMLPQAALAHDELISSDPEDGATVETGPDELTLTFSGQIAEVGAAVAVTDGDDASVVDGDPVVDGTTVVQDLVDDLAAGDYEVMWRVTSEDGHPISGTFTFAVEQGPDDGDDAAEDDATEGDAAEDGTTEDDADDQATADDAATEDAADEPTEEATAEETSEAPTADSLDDATTADDESSGMPVWAWVVIGLGVAGLVALLARTWSRNRA